MAGLIELPHDTAEGGAAHLVDPATACTLRSMSLTAFNPPTVIGSTA